MDCQHKSSIWRQLTMEIHNASFLTSSAAPDQCPKPDRPEYAFIGRSNVGKSSLINMITGRNKLAKTSSTPGKTQLINHFNIDDQWYLVDLPGYGYAKAPKKERLKWENFSHQYFQNRPNLMCVFVLIDSRLPPQDSDMNFMYELGKSGIPFVIVFTKIDKLKSAQLGKNLKAFQREMLKAWEAMPSFFSSSATSRHGRSEILRFIGDTNKLYSPL